MSSEAATRWRKSRFSGNDANCVELAWPGTVAAIRDSKSPNAGTLRVPVSAFEHLVSAVR